MVPLLGMSLGTGIKSNVSQSGQGDDAGRQVARIDGTMRGRGPSLGWRRGLVSQGFTVILHLGIGDSVGNSRVARQHPD